MCVCVCVHTVIADNYTVYKVGYIGFDYLIILLLSIIFVLFHDSAFKFIEHQQDECSIGRVIRN